MFDLGNLIEVKILGVLAIIHDGKLDWKVIAMSNNDPFAEVLNDIHDIEKQCPGVVNCMHEWLHWYNILDSKHPSLFGFEERAVDEVKALDVNSETHEAWKKPSLWQDLMNVVVC